MSGAPDLLRLVVDGASCDGHAICALVNPERISLDEWGYAIVDPAPVGDSRELARARRTVECCPARALSLRPVAAPRLRPRVDDPRRDDTMSLPPSAIGEN